MRVHANPYGITEYVGDEVAVLGPGQAREAAISLQMHWKASSLTPNPVGPLVPGISHTHIQGKFPIWAELGGGPITRAFTLLQFETVGKIVLVGAQFMGANGPMDFSQCVVDQPLPFVGNPAGITTITGHVTFDPALTAKGVRTDRGEMADAITEHGFFNTRIYARVLFDDGTTGDLEAWIPYYSVLNPTVPETGLGEGLMSFVAKARIEVPGNVSGSFGLQLTEFRGTEGIERGYVPILAPFNAAQTIYPFGYNYLAIPPTFDQTYELRLDGDFHMGVPGTVIDSTEMQLPNGQLSNVAVLDPTVIAASKAPMGTTPGKHRLIAMWSVDTKDGAPGYAPNQRLVTVIVIEVEIGDHPVSLPPAADVMVPDVVGTVRDAAVATMKSASLHVGLVSTLHSETVQEGLVIGQVPAAGAMVPANTFVSLQVSLGPVPVTPPPSEWEVITPIIKRLGVPGHLSRFCLCVDGTTECVELMVGPDPEAD